jgi:hypothetical protein
MRLLAFLTILPYLEILKGVRIRVLVIGILGWSSLQLLTALFSSEMVFYVDYTRTTFAQS